MNNQRIAILIQCHTNPEQINLLLDMLKHPMIDLYIHVDKKSSIRDRLIDSESVYILSEEKSVDVKWGQISQVEATLNLIDEAINHEDYGYYILISGQDWPCKSVQEIVEMCSENKNRISYWKSKNHGGIYNSLDKRNDLYFPLRLIDRRFMLRLIKRMYVELTGGYKRTFKLFKRKNTLHLNLYYGSSWWGINQETMSWIIDYLRKTPEYYNFYINSACPDESFFQTLVMMSPYADIKTDYLTYLNFIPGKNSPEWLTNDDIEIAYKSKYYFMRKLDLSRIDDTKLFNKKI